MRTEHFENSSLRKKALPVVTLAGVCSAYFAVTMCWLHHRQLCVDGRLCVGLCRPHLEAALRGNTYTAAFLLGPAGLCPGG